jgi:hypothetical protein
MGDYSPRAFFLLPLFAFDTTIDARATVPPKVSITNQGQWPSKGALVARSNRVGHLRPNPASRGLFTLVA